MEQGSMQLTAGQRIGPGSVVAAGIVLLCVGRQTAAQLPCIPNARAV